MKDMQNKGPSSSLEGRSQPSGQSWYQKWHNTTRHSWVHWGILLIVVAVAWGLFYTRVWDYVASLNEPGVTVKLNKANTEIALDPQTAAVHVGDSIVTNIMLDTKSQPVDGVDIYSLHYDPTLLQVVDDVPGKPGVQIMPGTILANNAANIVDKASGTIKFSQLATPGTNYQGKGILATIHFKAISTGTAFLKFDFTPGNTIDSNAPFRGQDRLSKVVDAIYTIEKKQ